MMSFSPLERIKAAWLVGLALLLLASASLASDAGYPDACKEGGLIAPPPEALAILPDGKPIASGWEDEEVLVREALRRGLDRLDVNVQRRRVALIEQMPAYKALPELERQRLAAELEIGNDDPFIRRRLVSKLRFLLEAEEGPIRPSEETLQAYFATHRDAYRQPERIRISQIFLDADQRGADLEHDAAALVAELRQRPFDPKEVLAHSDMSLLRLQLPLADEAQLTREFGGQVAKAVLDCSVTAWCDPIASPHGMHVVWVHEREAPRLATFDEARRAVQLDYITSERQRRFETAIAALRNAEEQERATEALDGTVVLGP